MIMLDILMVAACIVCTSSSDLTGRIAGWSGVVFFGGILIVLLRTLFVTAPMYMINEQGIRLRKTKQMVPWRAVKGIWASQYRHNKFLSLEIDNPRIYLGVHSQSGIWLLNQFVKFNKSKALGTIQLNFTFLKPGLQEAKEYISELNVPQISNL